MRKGRWLPLLLSLCLLCGCAAAEEVFTPLFVSETIPPFPSPSVEPAQEFLQGSTSSFEQSLSAFAQAAFDAPNNERLRRWGKKILFYADGAPTREDLDNLASILSLLKKQVPLLPEMGVTQNEKEANFLLHYVPFEKLREYALTEGPTTDFLFACWPDEEGYIAEAMIAINTDKSTAETRRAMLLSGMMRCLGLSYGTDLYKECVCYRGWSTYLKPAPLDTLLLTYLYHRDIKNGMRYDEAAGVLTKKFSPGK